MRNRVTSFLPDDEGVPHGKVPEYLLCLCLMLGVAYSGLVLGEPPIVSDDPDPTTRTLQPIIDDPEPVPQECWDDESDCTQPLTDACAEDDTTLNESSVMFAQNDSTGKAACIGDCADGHTEVLIQHCVENQPAGFLEEVVPEFVGSGGEVAVVPQPEPIPDPCIPPDPPDWCEREEPIFITQSTSCVVDAWEKPASVWCVRVEQF